MQPESPSLVVLAAGRIRRTIDDPASDGVFTTDSELDEFPACRVVTGTLNAVGRQIGRSA